jgi:hypothetical protein
MNMMALNYHWPPGSWDHLKLARAERLIQAMQRLVREMRPTPRLPDG